MNGAVCCILGVCCPPLSAAQRKALASEFAKAGLDTAAAAIAADVVIDNYDLAPAGTLRQFKETIGKMARASKDKSE